MHCLVIVCMHAHVTRSFRFAFVSINRIQEARPRPSPSHQITLLAGTCVALPVLTSAVDRHKMTDLALHLSFLAFSQVSSSARQLGSLTPWKHGFRVLGHARSDNWYKWRVEHHDGGRDASGRQRLDKPSASTRQTFADFAAAAASNVECTEIPHRFM